MAPIPPYVRSAPAEPWRSSINGRRRHAEDEDEARRAQAAEAHGVGQADAGGRLEAAQARGQVAEAAAQPAQEEAHRQGGPGAAPSAGSLPVKQEEERADATGEGWTEDAPTAQEDPQAGEGLRRRP